MSQKNPQSFTRQSVIAPLAGSTVAVIGGAALLGWWLNNETLKSIIPGSSPLKPNIAAGMLFCGVAQVFLSLTRSAKLARICAALAGIVVLVLGGLTLCGHFFGWNLGVDQWLIPRESGRTPEMLRMAVNARDATPGGGLLTIAVENFQVDEHYASLTPEAKAGPHVMLRISDTGEGMPRAVIDQIFDPFSTTREIGKGTGLGLSTTLGIVKSHGGFISVYSEIRRGATFKIFLPAQPTEQSFLQPDMAFESLKGNGESILVVDDEPAVLTLTKVLLDKHNYHVTTANDAPEALALFAQQMAGIDAVLTDIVMPYMDCIALIRAVQQMKSGLKFIASTDQGEETRGAEPRSLGVANFLIKPYDTQKLLQCLHYALNPKTDEP